MRPADLIAELGELFAHAGFASPGADARILVAHAAGEELTTLLTRWELDDEVVNIARELAQQRLTGIPVQHITGTAHFRWETLAVGPGVFIPRPETEILVDLALLFLKERSTRRVVELCAGSGAISRSIVREMGGVEMFANERSVSAGEYLSRNLQHVPVTIEMGDMRDAFPQLNGTVDLVVANPPYVPERVRTTLPRDVVGRDPDEALFAGDDGLSAMPVVIATACRLLKRGGGLLVEHDESHQPELMEMCSQAGFEAVTPHKDLAGRPRFVAASWPASLLDNGKMVP